MDFKVGDWVNVEIDAEEGNRDPGVITRIEGANIHIRWPWNEPDGECGFEWSAEELMRVAAPATGEQS